MNMTKKHIEATLSKMLHEYEHLAIQHLDSVKLLPVIDYGDQSRKLDDDFYGYRDKLLGIRDLIFTATYTPSPEYLLCLQAYDELVSLWNRFTDQVLSLARESRLRRDNQPVFAPTTQAVELVLVPPSSPVELNQQESVQTIQVSISESTSDKESLDWKQTSIDGVDSQGVEQPALDTDSIQTIEFTHLGKKGEYLTNGTYSWPIGSRFRNFKYGCGVIQLSISKAINQINPKLEAA